MKKSLIFLIALLVSATTFSNSIQAIEPDPIDEFETLASYLETNVDFIKGDMPIIMADEVKKNFKNEKYHIIDIRSDSWFEYGHIKNANNVKAAELLNYFETKIKPADYEKIVLICYSGQSAAYYTGLLRIAGYNNVYSMKWGMSSWREDFAEGFWLKKIKSDGDSKLETTENPKAEVGVHPTLSTGKTDAKDILRARLEELFAKPYSDFIVKSQEVFETPDNYYIVNYCNAENYAKGHIPTAKQYQPGASLTASTDLYTLPTDKKIAVYESTGQRAAYVIAYLNVLGYDTGNIAYGSNSFMNDILDKNDWDAFSKKEINMYPVIE